MHAANLARLSVRSQLQVPDVAPGEHWLDTWNGLDIHFGRAEEIGIVNASWKSIVAGRQRKCELEICFLVVVPAFLLAVGIAAAQQAQPSGGAAPSPAPPPLIMTSTAFVDGAVLPARSIYVLCQARSCESSALHGQTFRRIRPASRSFFTIYGSLDPAKASRRIILFALDRVWNIPGSATSLPEGVPATRVAELAG